MRRELINGAYCLLGELKGSARAGHWLAHSLVTGELVVLALPTSGNGSPTAEELRREGSIFGEITNRHVQSVVDWGEDEAFVAWEYVPAWTLATVVRAAPPPSVAAVLQLMIELATGLAAVHNRGAVYRGLHPGRVLVMRDGTARLATTPESVLAKRGRLVETGPPKDTPIRYLAPEQIQGSITSRSDLYSLAVVSYELLTGRQIYAHPDPVTLAVEILETMPPPPSAHRADVPSEVDEFFTFCLARRPEDRPRNVASMVTYLNKLSSQVSSPETESLTERLGLHPVAYPLLASDRDRAELFQAFSESAFVEEDGEGEGPETERADAGRDVVKRARLVQMEQRAAEKGREASQAGTEGDGDERAREDPMWWLGELAGDEEPATEFLVADEHEFPLRAPGMTIGRQGSNGSTPDIDVRAIDPGMVVSREHAAFHFHDGVWHVLELRARNGTWVNGERLVPGVEMPLRSGDRLRLANVELTYEKRESSEVPSDEDVDSSREAISSESSAERVRADTEALQK